MPFSRPALADLINRTRNDVVSRLPDPDILRRANADVLARVLAGAAHGLYGYLDWLSRQIIYDTAEGEILERWASIWGITRKAATAATGGVTFTGSNGATVPAGSVLVAYDGQLYATSASATIAGGTATATATASAVGVAGNRAAGQTLTLQSPVTGVNSSATGGTLAGGTNTESDDDLRARLLLRIQQPPQGGDKADYVAWALEVAGVTRAWCYPQELGPGAVTVRFAMDGTYPDGIPQAADVTAVATHIDGVRPVTAEVTVVAPVAVPLNFTIGSLSPNTAEVRAAITANLTGLVQREATPGGTIYLSHIREAISTASGEVNHVLVAPAADATMTTGNMTTMGTITWA